MIAKVLYSCGRAYLSVAGFAVAMEGDPCRTSNLPEAILPEIPEAELATATVGAEPARDLPREILRWFRGDRWNVQMLEFVAEKINAAHASK